MKPLAMFWKVLVLLGLALSITGEDTSHAISEQKVTIRHSQNGDSGAGKNNEHHKEYAKSYPSYEFSYKVSDPDTKDVKGQHETRDGDKVNGLYWLLQPNGFQRTVKYAANDDQGFKANVRFHSQKGNKYRQDDENNNQNSNANLDENYNENTQKIRLDSLIKTEDLSKPKQHFNYWSNIYLRNRNKSKPSKRPNNVNFNNNLQNDDNKNKGSGETTNSEERINTESNTDTGRNLKESNDKTSDLANGNNNNNENIDSEEDKDLNQNSNEKDGDNETFNENLTNGQNTPKLDDEDEKQTRNNAQEGSSNINKKKRLGNSYHKQEPIIKDYISNKFNVRGQSLENLNEQDATQEPDQEDNNDRIRNDDYTSNRYRKIKNRRKNQPSTHTRQRDYNDAENERNQKHINKIKIGNSNKKINNMDNDNESSSNQNSQEDVNIRNIESNTRDKSRSLVNINKSERHENKFQINARKVYQSNIKNINKEKDKFNARIRHTGNNYNKNNGHFRNNENLSDEVFEHHVVVYHPTIDETRRN